MSAEQQEPKERKTLDDRQKMTELERIRHSAAHVMATASSGSARRPVRLRPAVENGFYYDVELSHRISPEDFPKIEEEMKRNQGEPHLRENHRHARAGDGRRQIRATGRPVGQRRCLQVQDWQPGRHPEGEPITYYKSGDFIDLSPGRM